MWSWVVQKISKRLRYIDDLRSKTIGGGLENDHISSYAASQPPILHPISKPTLVDSSRHQRCHMIRKRGEFLKNRARRLGKVIKAYGPCQVLS